MYEAIIHVNKSKVRECRENIHFFGLIGLTCYQKSNFI